jgi:hypothetical protein
MTLLHDAIISGQPGTHVLAIGVGSYPYLLGGTKSPANRPLGLKQLLSPPVSVKAVVDWFLAPVLAPGTCGFVNSSAPLASIEALASAAAPITVDTTFGPVAPDPATRANIQDAFEAWLDRTKSHPDNVGVFYFCGHGVMVSDHYLLAEDFGRSKAQPWAQAFDISNTIRAVEREVPGTVYYFIDACREFARDVAMTLGADPDALHAVDLSKRLVRKSGTAIFATGEGELAFAPQGGQVSRFTSALLCALSGFSGIKAPGAATWDVDGESVATAIRQLLAYDALVASGKTDTGKQVSSQMVQGSSVPLLRIASPPKVKVWLDLTPTQRRARYELYLKSAKGALIAQKLLDQVFTTEVPRGFYDIGARDPAGTLPAVLYSEEELVPPMYTLTIKSQP